MKHRIAALNYLGLTNQVENAIQKMSDKPIDFPTQGKSLSMEEVTSKIDTADIILVSPGFKIDRNILDNADRLKYICLCGSSTSNIDIDYVNHKNIQLTTISHYGDEPTAEFIIAQITNLLRGIGDQQWKAKPHELMGKSLGIVGLGALGQAVANLALAYKMKVSYCGPHRKDAWDSRGLQFTEKSRILAESDIVILSGPGELEVISNNDFDNLRHGVLLVQASQGNVFDRSGFLKWISHTDNYAIFDLAAGLENYKCYSPLPRVVFPKTIAGHSLETTERLSKQVLKNIKNYIDSQTHA